MRIASLGKTLATIVVSPAASAPTKFASTELATALENIVGSRPEFAGNPRDDLAPVIFVGMSQAAKRVFQEVDFAELASDDILIKTKGRHLLLAGGGERGDLYAVSRFLQEQCGVRWWTPWASRIPENPDLQVGDLDIRYRPPFELRHPFWMPALDPLWAVRNTCNGESKSSAEHLGGGVRYKGFVHTYYSLVPPEVHYREHPEWFSLVNGKRIHDRAQLCVTDAGLREFMVGRVKDWLRESPEAGIVSVSQNDWGGACECDRCKSVDDREGTPAGSQLEFVNFVAERIEPEFPGVLVDTLAYQHTRKPPRSIRPRKNVVVRICADECNSRDPLDHPSNAPFTADIRGWSGIAEHLYVWDYTANFANFQPHPNWFTLGPNLRFLASQKVSGVFAQGISQTHGGELAELRGWVLSQLMWDPTQDDRALIREFLQGYFGPGAAQPIYSYLELMHTASEGFDLRAYAPTDSPFLAYPHLAAAEELWTQAEKEVEADPELRARVRLARLPLRYVWLKRWEPLRREAAGFQVAWPLPLSRDTVVEDWKSVVEGLPEKPWTRISVLNEAGLTSEDFLAGKNLKY